MYGNSQYQNRLSIPAQTLTTVATKVINGDCDLDALVFCNKTGGSITVTVQDAQGKNILNAMSIAANSTQQVPFTLPGPVEKGQFMKGGVQWFASANSSIDAHIMARK